MKLLVLSIFCIILLQMCSEALSATNYTENSLVKPIQEENKVENQGKYVWRNINCNSACSMRCVRSSRKKLCVRACQSCCFQCKCVPPGTHGNHHLCPCYARLRTHGNRPKCP